MRNKKNCWRKNSRRQNQLFDQMTWILALEQSMIISSWIESRLKICSRLFQAISSPHEIEAKIDTSNTLCKFLHFSQIFFHEEVLLILTRQDKNEKESRSKTVIKLCTDLKNFFLSFSWSILDTNSTRLTTSSHHHHHLSISRDKSTFSQRCKNVASRREHQKILVSLILSFFSLFFFFFCFFFFVVFFRSMTVSIDDSFDRHCHFQQLDSL